MATCKCQVPECLNMGTILTSLKRRGNRAAYLCEFHANNLEGYSTEPDTKLGTEKVNPFTFGWECETVNASLKGRCEMAGNKFIPTSDSSLGANGVEFKSPIYQGMNGIIKHAVSVEALLNSGDIAKDSRTGDHTHVGHKELLNSQTMEYVRRFYHSLFIPLCREMKADPQVTKRMFGRYFVGYASPIDHDTYATSHANFINVQHGNTLEYRIVRFRTAAQYQNCVRFCKAATEAVCNNFIAHFNDPEQEGMSSEQAKAYRKHKADIAANKIVKLYRKYAAQAPMWIDND